MSLPDLGFGSKTNHDQLGGTTYPRYMVMYAERKQTSDSTPNDEDPIFGFRGATTHTTGTDAKVYIGILNGVLPSPEHNITVSNLNAGIVIETDRVTVKPVIVLDPTTETIAPETKGALMYDIGTDELKYYDGAWQIVSAGGLSAHALDGAYHTATGLTVGWVIAADSATTFSWQAPTGGMSAHDLTGAYHTEDATGGAGNFLKADSGTTFSWQAHGLSASDVGAYTTAQVDSAIDTDITTHAALTDVHHSQNHALIDTTGHTVSGLTGGHFLKANTATTYSFQAHGLSASDVGAYTTAQTDSAIDADIVTHASNTDAHHPKSHDMNSHSDATLVPGSADQMIFWDYSDSQYELLTANTGLSISGNNLNCNITQYTDTLARTACISDEAYGSGWSTVATIGASKGALFTKIQSMDSNISANTTPTEVEAIITAELVNGQSIDLAIDSLISTHAGDDDAHHAVFESSDFTTAFAAESLANLNTKAHSDLDDAPTDAHHSQNHILASTGPHIGVLPWTDLSKVGSSLLHLATRNHGSLSDAPTSAHHVRYADSEVESVITAELVNGQSIDLAIDSLISSHAGDDDAHHALVSVYGKPLSISAQTVRFNYDITHFKTSSTGTELLIGLDTPAGGEVLGYTAMYGVNWVASYGDTDVEDVITAELVDGQSIDLAIDSLIATHATDNDAHQALASVTALPLTISGQAVTFNYNSNHFKLTGNNLEIGTDTPGSDEILKWSGGKAVWATPAGGTDYDADLVIGQGNATWINCPYQTQYAYVSTLRIKVMSAYLENAGSANPSFAFEVPLPTNRGGKTLRINKVRYYLTDADGSNYISSYKLFGYATSNGAQTEIDADPTNISVIGPKLYDYSGAPKNCGSYAKVAVWLGTLTSAAGDFELAYVEVQYYYA